MQLLLHGKRKLVALLKLSSWCLVMVEPLFLAVARGCLRFVIVVFPDHTHYFWFDMKVTCHRINEKASDDHFYLVFRGIYTHKQKIRKPLSFNFRCFVFN